MTDGQFLTPTPGIVTVLMPVYETPPARLRRSLESVAAQTAAERVQLVVVDDGSSPDVASAVRAELATVGGSVWSSYLLTLNRNVGYPAARNAGLGVAIGDWVLLLDSDDYLSPHAVSTILDDADPGALLVYSDHLVHPAEGESFLRAKSVYQALHEKHRGTIQDPMLSVTYIFHPQVYRRQWLVGRGGFQLKPWGGEEFVAHLLAAEEPGRSVQHIPDALYHYCPGDLSITADDRFYVPFIKSVSTALVEGAQRRELDVRSATRVGRAVSTHAAHYALMDSKGGQWDINWFDYDLLDLRPEEGSLRLRPSTPVTAPGHGPL